MRWRLVAAAVLAASVVYLLNASWLAPAPGGRPLIIAHRGVHQPAAPGIADNGCKGTSIGTPRHRLIENSLPSMAAAFAAGADFVEFDVRATADKRLAVFHDEDLACRTDGAGRVADTSMASLQRLDIGYGYRADGEFPLRTAGMRLLPAVEDVLRTFPDGRFVIHVKGGAASDADLLIAAFTRANVRLDERYIVYGRGPAIERLRALAPHARIWDKDLAAACAVRYAAYGWMGIVPGACSGSVVPVPINFRWLAWGWPNRFLARMRAAQAVPVLLGEVRGFRGGTPGVDSIEDLASVPPGFYGGIWTDRVEIIGKTVREP